MTAEVIKAHLDALEAQVELAIVQIKALRHVLEPMFAPKATVALDPRCAGIPAARCALQDDAARLSRASFGNRNAWQCLGCGYTGGVT